MSQILLLVGIALIPVSYFGALFAIRILHKKKVFQSIGVIKDLAYWGTLNPIKFAILLGFFAGLITALSFVYFVALGIPNDITTNYSKTYLFRLFFSLFLTVGPFPISGAIFFHVSAKSSLDKISRLILTLLFTLILIFIFMFLFIF